jgi:hypothetical protein
MAFLDIDPTPMLISGFSRVLVPGRPKYVRVVTSAPRPVNEDLAIVTITNLPQGEFPFAETRNRILELIEGEYALRVVEIQRSPFARGQAFVRLNRVSDRDSLVHFSPHFHQGLSFSFAKHNRGPNARRVLFNRECWLMLIGFPVDSRNVDEIKGAIKSFGRLILWQKDDILARVIIKARVTSLEDVPHYFVLSEGDDFEGTSLTVQCEIMQQDMLGGQLQDEDIPPGGPGDDFVFPGFGQQQQEMNHDQLMQNQQGQMEANLHLVPDLNAPIQDQVMLEAIGDDIVGHLDGNMQPADALAEDVDMLEPQEIEEDIGPENPVELDLVALSPPPPVQSDSSSSGGNSSVNSPLAAQHPSTVLSLQVPIHGDQIPQPVNQLLNQMIGVEENFGQLEDNDHPIQMAEEGQNNVQQEGNNIINQLADLGEGVLLPEVNFVQPQDVQIDPIQQNPEPQNENLELPLGQLSASPEMQRGVSQSSRNTLNEDSDEGQMVQETNNEEAFPEFLPALNQDNHSGASASINFNVNINMALTEFVTPNEIPLNGDKFLGTQLFSSKPKPDVYRLWAKYFSPVGCPEHVVQIPSDWAAFFTVMLLSPNQFAWAKNFLSSPAWKVMLSCSGPSALMSFAIPSSCPQEAEVTCASVKQLPDNPGSQSGSNPNEQEEQGNSSGKSKAQTSRGTPVIETGTRRSPRIRDRNSGFKHNTCLTKNCLACSASPPSFTSKMIKEVGEQYCKISSHKLSDSALADKRKGKMVVGPIGVAQETSSSQLSKTMQKKPDDATEDQGASKKGKKQ